MSSVKRPKTPRAALGAFKDDPLAMVNAAIAEAEKADDKAKDNLPLRRAAELGWLAASSTADVLAKRMGHAEPKGANGRRAVLKEVETAGRMKRGTLVIRFDAAQGILHGDCFHENDEKKCVRERVLDHLEQVKEMVDLALKDFDE